MINVKWASSCDAAVLYSFVIIRIAITFPSCSVFKIYALILLT